MSCTIYYRNCGHNTKVIYVLMYYLISIDGFVSDGYVDWTEIYFLFEFLFAFALSLNCLTF